MFAVDATNRLQTLTKELANFEEMAHSLLPQPGERPRVHGIDLYGGTIALNGVGGGDHLIYIDFKQRFDLEARIADAVDSGRWAVVENLRRCQRMAGVALIDVSGHRMTDALMAAMMHQALLLGAIYELDTFGGITSRLFENLNTRFYQSSAAHKFVSLIYGEISEDATFRFLTAAQPAPIVFSRAHGRLMDVPDEACVSFPPIGILPSFDVIDRHRTSTPLGFKPRYEMNEWRLLGQGDVMLLCTDGLADHERGGETYCRTELEATLRAVQDEDARTIFDAITADLRAFAPLTDDVSLVVIKRTSC